MLLTFYIQTLFRQLMRKTEANSNFQKFQPICDSRIYTCLHFFFFISYNFLGETTTKGEKKNHTYKWVENESFGFFTVCWIFIIFSYSRKSCIFEWTEQHITLKSLMCCSYIRKYYSRDGKTICDSHCIVWGRVCAVGESFCLFNSRYVRKLSVIYFEFYVVFLRSESRSFWRQWDVGAIRKICGSKIENCVHKDKQPTMVVDDDQPPITSHILMC
jgi:hypothetical protein